MANRSINHHVWHADVPLFDKTSQKQLLFSTPPPLKRDVKGEGLCSYKCELQKWPKILVVMWRKWMAPATDWLMSLSQANVLLPSIMWHDSFISITAVFTSCFGALTFVMLTNIYKWSCQVQISSDLIDIWESTWNKDPSSVSCVRCCVPPWQTAHWLIWPHLTLADQSTDVPTPTVCNKWLIGSSMTLETSCSNVLQHHRHDAKFLSTC